MGIDADRDVAIVKRIRDAIGPSRRASASTPTRATLRLARPSRPIGEWKAASLIYFEQPVHGLDRLAQVARAIDTPVMADESAWNAHDVIQIIEKRAAQIVSIYTTKPGGLYPRDAGRGRLPRGRDHLQRQRIDRDRRRQSRQYPACLRGGASGPCPASFRSRPRPRRSPARSPASITRTIFLLSPCGWSTARSNCQPGPAWASRRIRQDRQVSRPPGRLTGHARHSAGSWRRRGGCGRGTGRGGP